MVFLARWSVQAVFGRKSAVIDACKKWYTEIGKPCGHGPVRIYVASIGESEATINMDTEVQSLAELEGIWAKFREDKYKAAHQAFSAGLTDAVVGGSPKWSIWRVEETLE